MGFILKRLPFKSIKMRVVMLISTLIAFAIFSITLLVLFIVNSHMSNQMDTLLETRAASMYEKLDQRIAYLVDNSILLTKNELIVNSLIDNAGRERYLPPLVANFMKGKDVLYLNIVDFDGRAIFQTQRNIPLYNQSAKLRAALALGKVSYFIEKGDDKLVIIAPIEYYKTTQGAAIIVFKIDEVAHRVLANDQNTYIRLLHNNRTVYSQNFQDNAEYQSSIHKGNPNSHLEQLGIKLQLGIPVNIYMAPLTDILFKLFIIGLFFFIVGILLANVLANGITEPVITLYDRVKNSDNSTEVTCSPLGTNDELEELAKAFDERSLLLQHQAQYDVLTDLPNRLLFLDRLEQSIKNSVRNREKFAVLFIDLDHFKEINDSLGHHFGDKLLIKVGEYLSSVLRGSDTVARMGGDEFTILVNNLENQHHITNILQKIMEMFNKPFVIAHRKLYVTCSIGIAMFPLHGKTPDELLKNSDAAMYRSKEKGRNTYQFYTNDMTEKALERITLETQLRNAIENKEFEVYFQPQVDINTNKIIGMEALVRWNHPEMGLVPPGKFIPLAEDTGLVVDIDRQVMLDAMTQFKQWLDAGYDIGVLSINLSMIQLNNDDFIDFVKNTIKVSRIPTKNLMFEVLETQVMRNPEHAIIMLQQLKNLGIKLAIDDFGTGHSSLAYIKRLPIDKLKIDQSFIMDALVDKDDQELTKAIISIAKNLNLEVIAEGVESKEIAEFLAMNRCNEAQGYFYYKPLNNADITQILSTQN